jgi:putative membrane protein
MRRRVSAGHNAAMHVIAIIAAGLAALIHVWFFVMESLWFMRPSVHGRFGLKTPEQAAIVRSFAYNQGFYNLFLAVGVAIGLGLIWAGQRDAGRAIVFFACGSMVAAGLVLVLHNARFARAAAIQAGPPLVAILAGWLLA